MIPGISGREMDETKGSLLSRAFLRGLRISESSGAFTGQCSMEMGTSETSVGSLLAHRNSRSRFAKTDTTWQYHVRNWLLPRETSWRLAFFVGHPQNARFSRGMRFWKRGLAAQSVNFGPRKRDVSSGHRGCAIDFIIITKSTELTSSNDISNN